MSGHVLLAVWMATLVAPLAAARPAAAQSWTQSVVEANRLRGEGKVLEAVAVLRKARQTTPALPPIHVLQISQYLVEYVTESPTLPRAEAQPLLQEAGAVADEMIKAKQEVRLAMMAKSMVLSTQAERVEQNAARKKALLAESERLFVEARYVAADGSPIAKTVKDEWYDAQRQAYTTGPDGKDREDVAVYERFLAKHPDYGPALLSIARYHQQAAATITDPSPKSVATRTRHLETASARFKRASEVATENTDSEMALSGLLQTLSPSNLNRPAEAAAIARSAVKAHPASPGLAMQLLETIVPTPRAADAATLRAAREALPATPEARFGLGVHLFNLDHEHRKTQPRDSTRLLLTEAAAAFDAALKLRPQYIDALQYKAVVLKAQATRLETDPARIKALDAEFDRLLALVKKLQEGKR